MAYSIDTAKAHKSIVDAGAEPAVAHAIVDTVAVASGELATELEAKLATKADVDIATTRLRSDLTVEIEKTTGVFTKWALGIAGLVVTITIAGITGVTALMSDRTADTIAKRVATIPQPVVTYPNFAMEEDTLAQPIRDMEDTLAQLVEEVRALSLERRSSEPDD